MKDYSDVIKYLKETGASFEDIENFKQSIKDVKNGDIMTLEESKKSFLKYNI